MARRRRRRVMRQNGLRGQRGRIRSDYRTAVSVMPIHSGRVVHMMLSTANAA